MTDRDIARAELATAIQRRSAVASCASTRTLLDPPDVARLNATLLAAAIRFGVLERVIAGVAADVAAAAWLGDIAAA